MHDHLIKAGPQLGEAPLTPTTTVLHTDRGSAPYIDKRPVHLLPGRPRAVAA